MANAYLKLLIVFSAIAVSCYGIDAGKSKAKKDPVESKGFAVIELFTSEGCSSCPAADELVSKILNEHKENVYILSYHVDYWNRLGWKDEFSKAAFSDRQKQYARSLSLEGIYTPQIVVNGTEEFVGSDEARLRSSLVKSSRPNFNFSIDTEGTSNSSIKLNYNGTGVNPILLNAALIQPEAFTDVSRGENSGKKLHHVNIVRELKTIETNKNSGSIDIAIPRELLNMPLQIVVFIQQKNNLKITGVRQINIHQ